VIEVVGGFIYIKGPIDTFLNLYLKKKYSYELKNAYFIKKARPNANTTVQFWNEKYKRLPIGFFEPIKKTLHDYAEFKKKVPVITINDKRCFDTTIIKNMPDRLLSGKELRPYQTTAIDIFVNKHNIGMLEITTGAGKSLIATEIVRRLKMKTLFVVDKKELLYQIKQTFEENLGIKIGVIGDGVKQIEDVTVATIQTLIKNIDDFKDYLEEVRFVIFDETHKIASKSYYTLGLYLKNTERRAGFSGTAFRDDGNDMMLTATCGDIIFSLTGQELIDQGYLMKPEIIFIKQKLSKNKLLELTDNSKEGLINEVPKYKLYYDSFIINNEDRNLNIKKIVDENLSKTILILVKYIEHGKLLEELIQNSKYVYGETNGKLRNDIVSDFKAGILKVLVSTISIFAEGVDIPALDIVINAAANKGDVKSIQVLGRVLRRKEGKEKAMYYDFADEGIFFRNAGMARMEAFRNEGHAIEIKKIEEKQ
jgi:superfamily II DNA or RNA helicase